MGDIMTDSTDKFDIRSERLSFWKNLRVKCDRGEPGSMKIYEAVGVALSTWESVEECMVHLFMMFTGLRYGTAEYRVVARAFGSIEFGSGRRDATEAAAEAYFGPYIEIVGIEFNNVLLQVSHAANRRNDIAHGRVLDIPTYGRLLLPPRYNTGRTLIAADDDEHGYKSAEYRFDADAIQRCASAFEELTHQLKRYADSVAKQGGKFSEEIERKYQRLLKSRGR
jgi:hypothetical protein